MQKILIYVILATICQGCAKVSEKKDIPDNQETPRQLLSKMYHAIANEDTDAMLEGMPSGKEYEQLAESIVYVNSTWTKYKNQIIEAFGPNAWDEYNDCFDDTYGNFVVVVVPKAGLDEILAAVEVEVSDDQALWPNPFADGTTHCYSKNNRGFWYWDTSYNFKSPTAAAETLYRWGRAAEAAMAHMKDDGMTLCELNRKVCKYLQNRAN